MVEILKRAIDQVSGGPNGTWPFRDVGTIHVKLAYGEKGVLSLASIDYQTAFIFAVKGTRSVSNNSMNCNHISVSLLCGIVRNEGVNTCSFSTLTFIPAYLLYSSSILLNAHLCNFL